TAPVPMGRLTGGGRYVKGVTLGKGTFGVVFKAYDTHTGRTVAIKKIHLGDCKEGVNVTALREIKLLQELHHPHIIDLIDIYPHKRNLNLVLEFMETDLENIIKDRSLHLSPADIKAFMDMKPNNILTAPNTPPQDMKPNNLLFGPTDRLKIADVNLLIPSPFPTHLYPTPSTLFHTVPIHPRRDMKPNNLLIGPTGELKIADFGFARLFGSPDRKLTHQVFALWTGHLSCPFSPTPSHRPTGELKIADFGFARLFGSPDRKLTHQVFALWYRAPELLFGSKAYGSGVDVWGAGCVFAELLLRRPFLQGSSDIDQLGKIFAALGTPREDQWPDMQCLPDYVHFNFCPAPPLKSHFPMAGDDALDLLSRMLTFDPNKRITASQALQHRRCSLDLLSRMLTFDPNKRITAAQALQHWCAVVDVRCAVVDVRCAVVDVSFLLCASSKALPRPPSLPIAVTYTPLVSPMSHPPTPTSYFLLGPPATKPKDLPRPPPKPSASDFPPGSIPVGLPPIASDAAAAALDAANGATAGDDARREGTAGGAGAAAGGANTGRRHLPPSVESPHYPRNLSPSTKAVRISFQPGIEEITVHLPGAVRADLVIPSLASFFKHGLLGSGQALSGDVREDTNVRAIRYKMRTLMEVNDESPHAGTVRDMAADAMLSALQGEDADADVASENTRRMLKREKGERKDEGHDWKDEGRRDEGNKRKDEENKRKDEENKRKDEENKRKDEENKRRDEENKRKDEVNRRKVEENGRKDEENMRKDEENRRKDEENKRKDEENKRKDEENKRKDEENKRKDEENKRKDEENKRKDEEENKRKDEENKRKDEENKRKDEENKRKDEENKRKDEENKRKDEENKRKDEENKRKDEENKRKDEENKRKDEENKRKDEENKRN
ncbi:unnamed protein product, partial [Closterium sp. Naga37s-1]